ncbi:MAG: hypothetical protein QM697_06755 [Lachnospiraceae bacterium]
MMRIKKLVLFSAAVLMMAGCSNTKDNSKYVNNQNNVDQVLEEQINNAAEEDDTPNPSLSAQPEEPVTGTAAEGYIGTVSSGTVQKTDEQESQENADIPDVTGTDGVDYDLTSMGSDMVYVTVYQFMVNPEDYIGKTVRIKGDYYASWYEPSEQYYQYCIIQDATACCAQGMEFVWGDGSHHYPDEYPEENAEIIVTGTFGTYYDEADSYLYCRLEDASLEVVSQ